jgi:uncharacterized integral membrane protein
MKLIKGIILLLLFFFALTFCLQNTDEVTVRYHGLMNDVTTPLFAVVLVSAFIGVVIGLIGGGLSSLKFRMRLMKLAKEAEALQQEVASLKGNKRKEKEKKTPET